ncbi:MAG: hypothetical protein STSR0004_17810 [Peptococcaceae bacterium]
MKEKMSHVTLNFSLTPREKEIIQLVTDGHTSRQIASLLCLSIYTVKTHRKAIYHKLGVNSLAELIHAVANNNESKR